MSETRLEKKHSNFVIALLLLFPVVINSIKIFGNLILLILFVLGTYIAISESKNPFKIKELKVFSWLTTGYFLVMLLSMLHANGLDADFHHLGRKIHFLLAPLIALAIFQADLSIKRLLLSIKIGLILIGIIVIVQFLLGYNRPSGMINANIFGDIAVAMLFLSIVRVFSEKPKEQVITFVAILAGISAIFLSENRGSWLSFLVLSIVYIGLIYKPFLQEKIKRKIFLVLMLSVAIGFIGTQTDASKRISKAVTEIQNWHSGSELKTSLGLRMEMWRSGLSATKQAPWLGYGYRNANQVASEHASNNKIIIQGFTHLHNEYITNLVSAGIIGLFSVLVLLFVPVVIFYRKLKNKDTYHYASMGILLCIGYATFGFSHIAFGEEHVNAFYVFFLGLLLPLIIKTRHQKLS